MICGSARSRPLAPKIHKDPLFFNGSFESEILYTIANQDGTQRDALEHDFPAGCMACVLGAI